ncbi:hypothetical protein [Metabacillus endolithicus]|nr:hypothetical protein [Metabacillus endolithicus]
MCMGKILLYEYPYNITVVEKQPGLEEASKLFNGLTYFNVEG